MQGETSLPGSLQIPATLPSAPPIPDPLEAVEVMEFSATDLVAPNSASESNLVGAGLDMAMLGIEEMEESITGSLHANDNQFSPLSDIMDPVFAKASLVSGDDSNAPGWGQNLLGTTSPSGQVTVLSNYTNFNMQGSIPQHSVSMEGDLPPWGIGKTEINTIWDTWTRPDETLDDALTKRLKIEMGKSSPKKNSSTGRRSCATQLESSRKPAKKIKTKKQPKAPVLSLASMDPQPKPLPGSTNSPQGLESGAVKDETIFKCRLCDKLFERRYNLKVHMSEYKS